MFVQISSNENDLSESLCSLNFASKLRGIELGPAKKQIENAEVLKYKQMAEKYKHEMQKKDMHIKKLEDNFHGLDMIHV
ncbi:kinesin-like protein KIN-14Q [Tanacetum coccineum]